MICGGGGLHLSSVRYRLYSAHCLLQYQNILKDYPHTGTIENNGLIILAIGAYMLASHYHLILLADFALIAALYHSFSHSISKASLFLIMGWISKVKGSFDLNSTQHLVLTSDKKTKIATNLPGIITILSLAAMPPLAGFVSEWMILEVLFQSFRFGDTSSQIIGILVGAIARISCRYNYCSNDQGIWIWDSFLWINSNNG